MTDPTTPGGTTGDAEHLADATLWSIRMWTPTIDRWAAAGLAASMLTVDAEHIGEQA